MIIEIVTQTLFLLNVLSFISLLFLVFLLLVPIKKMKFKKNFFPQVSIVICVRNEEKTIEKCIKSLLSLDYPKTKREIIVVSDSTDRTNDICEKYRRSIKLIKRINKRGKWSALNYGIEKAKGDIIATTDGDITFSKDWLKNLVNPLQNKKISHTFGIGSIKNPTDNFLTKGQYFLFSVNNIVIPILAKLNLFYFSPGFNMAFRKKVWKKFKFRRGIAEDVDFSYRLLKHGYDASFIENAKVYVNVLKRLKDLRYQQVRWSYLPRLDFKLFFLVLWIVFLLLFPGIGALTLMSLVYTKISLLYSVFIINLLLCLCLYFIIFVKTKINPMYGLYWSLMNIIFFFMFLESLIRSILKKPITWK